MNKINILIPSHWNDYALLDSGNGKKLERFGKFSFVRPEPQAMWEPKLAQELWEEVGGIFVSSSEEGVRRQARGKWELKKSLPARWQMEYRDLKFWASPTPFRHMGVFPEQAVHWDWISERLKERREQTRILDLFGYTGIASLAAARAAAEVTHVDASPKATSWARENQTLSGLDGAKIRWIVDDALKFVKREARRGAKYDGIIIDPPKFGRGPKGEVWNFFESMPQLTKECETLLSQNPLFVIITSYAIRMSSVGLGTLLGEITGAHSGILEKGELGIQEESGGRILSQAIYAKWQIKS